MLLLAHIRTQQALVRHLVTATVRLDRESLSYSLHKNWRHGHTETYHERAGIFTDHLVSERPWTFPERASPLGQVSQSELHQDCVDDFTREVREASPAYNWLPEHRNRASLLDGLLGNGRYELSTCFKRCLITWPHICPPHTWPHICPPHSHLAAGYCTAPPESAYPLPRTRFGHTYSIDLSPSDQDKLKTIAYGELKTVLKASKVKYKKAQKKKPSAASKLLDEIAAHDIKEGKISPYLQVPKTLKLLFDHIGEHSDTENIFQTETRATKVKNLVLEIERKSKDPMYWIPDSYSTQDIASAVKTLLSGFPSRLMTTEKVDEYPDVTGELEGYQYKALNLFILSMSQPHRDTLHLLLRTLHMVDKNQGKSKMNADTLAPIFGPILFKMPDKLSQQEQETKLTHFSYLTKMLIRFNSRHFYVKPKLLAQLRESVGKEQSGASSNDQGRNVLTVTEASLLVSAPSMPKTSLSIKITPDTVAYEVVDAYSDICKKDGSIPNTSWKNCLFEVGGNIGERCLDPFAFIMDVYQANPAAEFVIRPSTVKSYTAFHSLG